MLELSIKSFDEGQLRIPNYGDIVLQNSWLSKDNKEYKFDRHSAHNVKQFLSVAFQDILIKLRKIMPRKVIAKRERMVGKKGFQGSNQRSIVRIHIQITMLRGILNLILIII